MGNLGGENKGTDGVGRAVLAYEKAFDLLTGLAYSHGLRYRCLWCLNEHTVLVRAGQF